jgi:protein involved in polysaccharide export with SLBB domain
VQEPGLLPFTQGMRVGDAVFRAGGMVPDHADGALLLRMDERWDRVRFRFGC